MCEFHDSNCNGLGDMWWTDKCIYFSNIDDYLCCRWRLRWEGSAMYVGGIAGRSGSAQVSELGNTVVELRV